MRSGDNPPLPVTKPHHSIHFHSGSTRHIKSLQFKIRGPDEEGAGKQQRTQLIHGMMNQQDPASTFPPEWPRPDGHNAYNQKFDNAVQCTIALHSLLLVN